MQISQKNCRCLVWLASWNNIGSSGVSVFLEWIVSDHIYKLYTILPDDGRCRGRLLKSSFSIGAGTELEVTLRCWKHLQRIDGNEYRQMKKYRRVADRKMSAMQYNSLLLLFIPWGIHDGTRSFVQTIIFDSQNIRIFRVQYFTFNPSTF